MRKKIMNKNRKAYICLLGVQKALDRIQRTDVWKMLIERDRERERLSRAE